MEWYSAKSGGLVENRLKLEHTYREKVAIVDRVPDKGVAMLYMYTYPETKFTPKNSDF